MAVILVVLGIYFALGRFGVFVDVGILPAGSLAAWVSAIYGSMMAGLGVIVFGAARLAVQKQEPAILRLLWQGIAVWLLLEAAFSFYLRVWFNVGVAIALLAFFSWVLSRSIRRITDLH